MTETQQYQQTPMTTPANEQRGRPASSPPRQIFREHALQHYIRKNEESVLPRTISPLVFTACWIALVLTTLVGFFVWSIPVPNYLNTPGIPTSEDFSANTTQTTTILAFFPASAQNYIEIGQAVQVGGSTLKTPLTGHITRVDTQHLNAIELSKRYTLSPTQVQSLPAYEAFVGTITTSQTIPLQNDTSNRVVVRYQQGTRQALSLLLNLSNP